jgi:hypothetical protein
LYRGNEEDFLDDNDDGEHYAGEDGDPDGSAELDWSVKFQHREMGLFKAIGLVTPFFFSMKLDAMHTRVDADALHEKAAVILKMNNASSDSSVPQHELSQRQ